MLCPHCRTPLLTVGKFTLCPEHGPLASVPTPSKLEGRVETLPCVLAIALEEYLQVSATTEAKLKLWCACEAVEMLLRFLVIAGIAEHRSTQELPTELLLELREHIERPTLRGWHAMARAIAQRLDPESAALPELRNIVLEEISPFILGTVQPATAETSFAELRNALAHGGGVTRAGARQLMDRWQDPIEALLEQTSFLDACTLVVRTLDGELGELRGPSGRLTPLEPTPQLAQLRQAQGSVFLIRGSKVLTLWPMALFGEPWPTGGERIEGTEVPQVYIRRDDSGLEFTPLGQDWTFHTRGNEQILRDFRFLFKLDRQSGLRGPGTRPFEEEIRRDAGEVVGRTDETGKLIEILKGMPQGVIWVGGQAGSGKSFTIAKAVATLLLDPAPETLLIPYRFKAGDERCTRGGFLNLAMERLEGWNGLAPRSKELGPTNGSISTLRERLRAILKGHRVVFTLDGLDEIALMDPRFALEIPLALALPQVLWVCVGREEAGLPEAFRKAGALEPWPGGLPRMGEADLHEMLLDRLGPLRKRLIRGDRDEGDRVVNTFVQRVARYAEGLPIYVRYVVNDALGGKLSPEAGSYLPPSLAAYHEKILERCDLGNLQQVLSPLVGLLGILREPLQLAALVDLLARRTLVTPDAQGEALVQEALAAIGTILRRRPGADGKDSFTLYHHSFREHVLATPRMRTVVQTARDATSTAVLMNVPGAPASAYLFSQGVSHLVEAGLFGEALSLLTDFCYLMARLTTLQPGGGPGLLQDWELVMASGLVLSPEQLRWEAFLRERVHILQRGREAWPAYKIFLQLAIEHGDDSPVTHQAEQWLAQNACSWLWLRNPWRPGHAAVDPCLRVLAGHQGLVLGATQLPDGRILSWSEDRTLRLWSPEGSELTVMACGDDCAEGARVLRCGQILSWGTKTMRLWSTEGALVKVIEGGPVDNFWCMFQGPGLPNGAIELKDGRLLAQELRSSDGGHLASLEEPGLSLAGALELRDGRLLTWFQEGLLRLCSHAGQPLVTMEGHTNHVAGALELRNGQILSWAGEGTTRLWSAQGSPVATLETDGGWVNGAAELMNGRLLSLNDGLLRIWYPDGSLDQVLRAPGGHINGWVELSDSRLLSWTEATLDLWTAEGTHLRSMEGHATTAGKYLPGYEVPGFYPKGVEGATELKDGRLLSWSDDHTLRLWSKEGEALACMEGHTGWVIGALPLASGHILSWSNDSTLRLWSLEKAEPASSDGHSNELTDVVCLRDRRYLSTSHDSTLRLWSSDGLLLSILSGHTERVWGALELLDGRILSWSEDLTLRLWSPNGAPLSTLCAPHGKSVHYKSREAVIGALELRKGCLVSWAYDGRLTVWSAQGVFLRSLEGHAKPVTHALELRDGQIFSMDEEGTLRLWSAEGAPLKAMAGHTEGTGELLELKDGRLLSWAGGCWSSGGILRLWSAQGDPLAAMEGHGKGRIQGVAELSDGRLLSWSGDGTLRLWSPNGLSLKVLEGHECGLVWAQEQGDASILSLDQAGSLRTWSESGNPTGSWRLLAAPEDVLERFYASAGEEAWVTRRAAYAGPWVVSTDGTAWHTTGGVKPMALVGDGTLLAIHGNRRPLCLKLYLGARQVDVREAADYIRTLDQSPSTGERSFEVV